MIQLLFESSLDGVLAFDRDCRYTHWNPAMERLTDFPASKVCGNIAFEIFPFLKEIGEDRYFHLALSGKPAVSDARPFHVPSTGKSGFFEGHYSPLRDRDGEIVGGMAIIRDITDRIDRVTEQRFRALVEQSPFSIQLYATDGRCTYANPAWEKFWQTNREVLTTYNILEDAHIAEQGLRPLFERAFRGEIVTLPDVPYDPAKNGKTGRPRWIRASFFPVHDTSGKLVEIAQVLEDISDTKALEASREELSVALEEARRAVRVRDGFLSIASHELRTPVTLMKMQIQRARRNIALGNEGALTPERFASALDHVDRSLNRLAKLVEQMLDVARIQSGRLDLEREEFALAVLVAEVLEQFHPQLDAAGIKPHVEVVGETTGYWDRHRIDQVVTNLLTNVIRYAPRAPLRIRIRRDGEFVALELRDGGPGIPHEDHDRIFRRFERLVTKNQVGGLGLGLHIAREIVHAHGGTIAVESAIGEGAVFIVRLPVEPA